MTHQPVKAAPCQKAYILQPITAVMDQSRGNSKASPNRAAITTPSRKTNEKLRKVSRLKQCAGIFERISEISGSAGLLIGLFESTIWLVILPKQVFEKAQRKDANTSVGAHLHLISSHEVEKLNFVLENSVFNIF
jgi:hypothetical protein